MKLAKLFLTTAVTSVAAAALAVSASAATATYADGVVTLSDINMQADQLTLLVLNNDATNVASEDITQIDQAEGFTTVPVGELEAGKTYYVRIGGDGTIEKCEFTVPGAELTYKLGDVNDDNEISGADAVKVANHVANIEKLTAEKEMKAADVNVDGEISGADAVKIANHVANIELIVE